MYFVVSVVFRFENLLILQSLPIKRYRGRVARQWSAKPRTAVRIRSVPQNRFLTRCFTACVAAGFLMGDCFVEVIELNFN